MSRRSTMSTKDPPHRAYAEGRAAAVAGRSVYSNPYRRGTTEWHQWASGWRLGRGWYDSGETRQRS